MKKILFLLGLSFIAFQLTCFADINVSGQTGIITITPAGGGAPITVNPGQSIPAIADGSTITIVTGTVKVSTTNPSTVNLSITGNKIALPFGSTVQVSLNSNGAIRVSDLQGTASVTTLDGKTTSLKQGQSIVIAGNKIANVEAYQPPDFNLGPVNTQVQIDNHRKDISPVTP